MTLLHRSLQGGVCVLINWIRLWSVHSLAVNSLVFGRKYWALSPPPIATLEYTRHPTQFFDAYDDASRRDESGVLRCIQESGDVLVVPDGWGHATLNLVRPRPP